MVDRARQCLPMANHLVFRPVAPDEPITRPDAQCIRKLNAEGTLRELITFLGWYINSRAFTICLPKEKASAWTASIHTLLNGVSVCHEDASTLIGRLNHVAFIIPSARHFLNRLRRLEYIADRYGRAMITPRARDDLLLWIVFLNRAHRGISINSVVFRKPTLACFSDASEHGIGGYCLNTGLAWRYRFSKAERESFTLNLKEFLGSVINGMVNLPRDSSPSPCLLSIGDSNCAAGWLHKSNFDPDLEPIHSEVAREHARTITSNDACEYSQHIPGVTNVVADCLSRDFHLSQKQLTSLLTTVKPPYLPQEIKFTSLSPTIVSWIGSLAQNQPRRKELPKKPTPSTLARGVSGWTTTARAGGMTPIWIDKSTPINYTSSPPSCTPFDVDRLIHDGSRFREGLRERPSAMWHRPLFRVVGLTPPKISTETPTSACSVKRRRIEKPTHQSDIKKPSHPTSSVTCSTPPLTLAPLPSPRSPREHSSTHAAAANTP